MDFWGHVLSLLNTMAREPENCLACKGLGYFVNRWKGGKIRNACPACNATGKTDPSWPLLRVVLEGRTDRTGKPFLWVCEVISPAGERLRSGQSALGPHDCLKYGAGWGDNRRDFKVQFPDGYRFVLEERTIPAVENSSSTHSQARRKIN